MREIKFWGGLGTILIFAGIYCFKAIPQKKILKEETEVSANTATNKRNKILLVLVGSIAIISGVLILIKSFKEIIE